jgi:hypothetical protein
MKSDEKLRSFNSFNHVLISLYCFLWIFILPTIIFIHYFSSNFSDSFVFMNIDPPAGLGGDTRFVMGQHYFGDFMQTYLLSELKEPYIGVSEIWQPCCIYLNANTPGTTLYFKMISALAPKIAMVTTYIMLYLSIFMLFIFLIRKYRLGQLFPLYLFACVGSIGLLSTVDRGNSIIVFYILLAICLTFLFNHQGKLFYLFLTLAISIKVWALPLVFLILLLDSKITLKIIKIITLPVLAYLIPILFISSKPIDTLKIFITAVFERDTAVSQSATSISPLSFLYIFSTSNNSLPIIISVATLLSVLYIFNRYRKERIENNLFLIAFLLFSVLIYYGQSQIYTLGLISFAFIILLVHAKINWINIRNSNVYFYNFSILILFHVLLITPFSNLNFRIGLINNLDLSPVIIGLTFINYIFILIRYENSNLIK